MNGFLIAIVVILAILVVVSLVRGIIAFLQSTKLDLESPEGEERAIKMQKQQNKMMMSRIKFQGLAIAVVVILMLVNR